MSHTKGNGQGWWRKKTFERGQNHCRTAAAAAASEKDKRQQKFDRHFRKQNNSISSVPKRNYWGHRYHVVPVDVNRHFDRLVRDFERSTANSFWRWPSNSSYNSFFRKLSPSLPEPFEAKLPTGERVHRLELDLEQSLHNFKPENIKVTVKNNEVLISAKCEIKEDGGSSVKQSREFSYQYSLPAEADAEKVRSVLKETAAWSLMLLFRKKSKQPPPKGTERFR
ncbi:hypothetical protein TYRP_003908 [Tyrophagus putrescentiae]|nr:hypothetical protein TYRP_003908 [Tyrophagus putrescentiae]